jgi:DNA-directed RNA polymerase specialized sigma24 family protein
VIGAPLKDWRLTQEAFDRFLAELDADRDAAGRKYETLRLKLISYFDWRDCPFPEEHADEALNRAVRKVSAGEEIRDVSTYVFGIARMLLLEIARTSEKERAALNQQPAAELLEVESDETQLRIEGLRQCLAALPEQSRELIIQYYQGDGPRKISQRKGLARLLGLELKVHRFFGP